MELVLTMATLMVISGSFLIFLYTPKGKKFLENM